MTTSKEFTARVKAFSGERSAARHRVIIDGSGTVRVWDSVAGHYTACHAMSQRTQDRLRSLSAQR